MIGYRYVGGFDSDIVFILNSEKNENILIKQNKDTCDKKGLG